MPLAVSANQAAARGENMIPDTYTLLPPGNAGALYTLERITAAIRMSDATVDAFLRHNARMLESMTETEAADHLFRWVLGHLVWQRMSIGHAIPNTLTTPDLMLSEIAGTGFLFGDCAYTTILLGALYRGLGLPVTVVAVSWHPDQELEHVYLEVDADGVTYPADAGTEPPPGGWTRRQPAPPFGWEIPAGEITARVEVPV